MQVERVITRLLIGNDATAASTGHGIAMVAWSHMEAVIDSGGRVVLPKQLRDALGLAPGATVDISAYGDGLRIVPGGRTARVARDADGRLVAQADTEITDEAMFALIDAARR